MTLLNLSDKVFFKQSSDLGNLMFKAENDSVFAKFKIHDKLFMKLFLVAWAVVTCSVGVNQIQNFPKHIWYIIKQKI